MTTHPREPRILFLINRYPPVYSGGALFLKLIRETIRPFGFRSIVLAADRGIQPGEDPEIYRLPTIKGWTSTRPSDYLFALMAGPAMFLLRRRYDLIQTMGNAHFVYVAIMMGRLLGKPVAICSVQNRCDDPPGILRERFGRLKNSIFTRADAFLCCSANQVDAYREAGYPDSKVFFIPSGFRPNHFHPCNDPEEKRAIRRRLGLPPEGFLVTSVGAIVERKGIDLLARAWGQFRKSGPGGTLVLVGPVSRKEPGSSVDERFIASVREQLARDGVADSVIFTGGVTNPDEYLRASDAFALMSRGEGFPSALLEAMGTALPFLIWDLPDYRGYQIKDGEQGFLIPPFEVPALARRLSELASSPELRGEMGRKALALSSGLSIDRCAQSYMAVYRNLAASAPTASPSQSSSP